jgi:hypothetical protein
MNDLKNLLWFASREAIETFLNENCDSAIWDLWYWNPRAEDESNCYVLVAKQEKLDAVLPFIESFGDLCRSIGISIQFDVFIKGLQMSFGPPAS